MTNATRERSVNVGVDAAQHRARGAWGAAAALTIGLIAAGCAAPPPSTVVATIEVAPGVYLLPGSGGEPEPGNLGRIGNAGFIVGETGVVAIDTGTSYRHGIALLAAIRRVTDKPVRLALVTHTRQEFLFGAAAFQQRGIPVAMQAQAATLMASRCENCLKTLRRLLGEDALQATVVVKPDRTFATAQRLEVLPDRPLELLYFGHSSGPGDIAVFDPRSGVLFAGGLVENGRIPDVLDSDLPGWHAALQKLRALPVHKVVPAHGTACNAGCIDAVDRYLTQLEAKARALLAADTPLSQIADAATLTEFEHWDLYDTTHRRNASVVFLRAEREQLFKSGG
jgi:glyoxylase-like metal-dependent hydrolase (beta-lactamase superfamily II)